MEGDYLFIAADGSNDILMYDISNPESPNPLGSTAGYYPAWGICVEGNYVYAAEMEAVEVFYFSDTESLTLMKRIITVGTSYTDIEVYGNHLYIASSAGLKMLKLWPY